MSKLISSTTRLRWSVVMALASAISLTSPVASVSAASQGDPSAEAGARPAASPIRGAKPVSNAPPANDLKGVGEEAAEATRAAVGSQASATAETNGRQGQTAAPGSGEGAADQSISDGRPLPAPNVDFVVKSAVDSVAPMEPAQIRKFRKQGYATELNETNEHAGCVAAPVIDGSGRCVAAISVVAPEHRLGKQNRDELIRRVREASAKLSGRLGAH